MSQNTTVGLVFYKESKDIIELVRFFQRPEFKNEIREILIVANAATTESVVEIQTALQAPDSNIRLIRQSENNLAKARQLVLDHTQTTWVYFTDPDCRPRVENLIYLFRSKNEKYFAISGPNRPDAARNPFYFSLNLLSQTWLGNFGSSQFKTWDHPQELAHAPTCNVLYNLNRVQFGFDPELVIVGEDLDFNFHHCHNNNNRILHLPQAWVEHNHPTTLSGWAKKVFKWGTAQPIVILRKCYWRQILRLAPLTGLFLSLSLLMVSPFIWFLLFVSYFFMTSINSFLVCRREQSFKYLGSHLILTWTTHLAYATGQLVGCWYLIRSLARVPLKSLQSLPQR